MSSIGILLLIAMLYMHIVDDYRHQGILAQMKQRDWWKENAPDELYKNDYIMALFEHAFSWTVAIHIPVIVYLYLNTGSLNAYLIGLFVLMWVMHAVVDHLKANRHSINLVTDQVFHICQILLVWIVYITYAI